MPAEFMLIASAKTFAARVHGAYIAFPPQLVPGSPTPPSSNAGGAPRPKLSAKLAAPRLAALR